MRIFKDLGELNDIVYKKWSELDKVSTEYLNDAGKAAIEAYRAVIWHIAFHDTIDSLRSDTSFQELSSIPNKHPEYYKILRQVNRALERASEV